MSFELPKTEKLCHHTGFQKKCRELVTSGTCDRWRDLPGASPFADDIRLTSWGCIDDLVLYLQGEAMRQADGTHTAITQFREMIINPTYLAKQIEEEKTKVKAIEVQK